MKKTLILVGFLALAPFAKGQLLLEALEGEIPFTPSEKCLERVKDKYYGDGDHNFIYCAVMGPGNKKWLNLNLGAEYAREGSEYFNPEAVPTDNNDWKAFGSLYNYNRNSDGHELVEYRQGTLFWEVKHKNGYTTNRPNAGEKSNVVATTSVPYDSWDSSNDPCPNGYQLLNNSMMRGTVGYSFKGGFKSATIIEHAQFAHWNLITAPIWSDEEVLEVTEITTKDGFKVTRSCILDNCLGGTSGLWLRGTASPFGSAIPKVSIYTLNGNWELRDDKKDNTPYLDRGWFPGNGSRDHLSLGTSNNSASAVRCVEK